MITAPRLYSVGQITGATFLGGPLSGGVLLALNYRALGEPARALKALVAGAVAMVVLVALIAVLPEGVPNGVIPVAYTIAMGQIAHSLQGARIAQHLEAGGAKGSHWRTAGLGCGGLVVFFVLAMAVLLALPQDKIEVYDSEVIWEDGATEEQARLVADYMTDIGVFGPEKNGITITVAQPDDALQLQFIIVDLGWEDAGKVASFQTIGDDFSEVALEGAPVEVWMCNDFMMPRKVLYSGGGEEP